MVKQKIRIVGLNAFSLSMIPLSVRYSIDVMPVKNLNELKENLDWIFTMYSIYDYEQVEWIHFIRHKPTLDLLRSVFPQFPQKPNDEVYTYRDGDILIIATLKTPRCGVDNDIAITENDLIYAIVKIRSC